MIKYIVSAFIAALALFATALALSKAMGPGSPGELFIVGKLELLSSEVARPPEPSERVPRPPERPRVEPPSR